MININFFKKEKKNILPYAAGGVFLLSALLIGAYLFFTYTTHQNRIEDNNQWLVDNAAEIELSREISELDQLATQSVAVQETLREAQYPMAKLTNDVMSFIPNEKDRVSAFLVSEAANQISLTMETTTTTQAQSIIEDLEEQPYIEDVEFLRADDQGQENDQYRFELIINLNMDGYVEEEAE